jgi:hypothetical protein
MEYLIKDISIIYSKFSKLIFTPEIDNYYNRLSEPNRTYEYVRPFPKRYIFDEVEFLIRDKHFNSFNELLKRQMLVDEEFKIISNKTVVPIFKEYGKGFYKGYIDLKNPLKPNTQENSIENRKLVYEIFSIIENESSGSINISLVKDAKIINELKKIYYNLEFYQVNKKVLFESGLIGGKFYKAWEIILENRTLFNEIFKKKAQQKRTKTLETKLEPIKETKITVTPDLILKDIPNFNLQQRYEIFTQLGYDKAIHTLDTSKSSKTKILALIMGISVDNAKHLINGTYKEFKPDDIEEFEEYLERIKVKL